MSLISCIISDALKYAFLAERETLLRVFELNAGIKAIPAIAPMAPQAIMLLDALRITIALPFRFYVGIRHFAENFVGFIQIPRNGFLDVTEFALYPTGIL